MAEDLKVKIQFEGGGLEGAARGKGSNTGLAGVAGKGSMLGAGALAGAVAAGVSGLLKAVKKGFDAVKAASPRLQATFNIFGKSIMMILRPIGDVMNMFLRPFALLMLRFAIPFYRNWREVFGTWFDLLSDKFGKGPEEGGVKGETPTETFQNIRDEIQEMEDAGVGMTNTMQAGVAGIEILTGSWMALWGLLKGVAGIVVLLVEGLAWLLDKALTPLLPAINLFADSIMSMGTFVSSVGDAIWDLATGGSWDEFMGSISEAFDTYVEDTKKAWNTFFEDFNKTLDKIMGVIIGEENWEKVKAFFTETIPSWFTEMFDSIKNFFTVTLPDLFTNLVSMIWEKAKSFVSLQNFLLRRQDRNAASNADDMVDDAIITKTGRIIRTSPDDNIIATKTLPGSMGGSNTANITINVNALDASSIDSTLIQKIASQIQLATRRSIIGQTTELS